MTIDLIEYITFNKNVNEFSYANKNHKKIILIDNKKFKIHTSYIEPNYYGGFQIHESFENISHYIISDVKKTKLNSTRLAWLGEILINDRKFKVAELDATGIYYKIIEEITERKEK